MEKLKRNRSNVRGKKRHNRAKKMPTVDTSGRFKTKNKKHEAKITKKWNIEDFQVSMLFIQLVYCTQDIHSCRTVEVCRPCFEQWLHDTGRLEWCMEGYDSEGSSIGQAYGTMAIDDYWENAEYEVKVKDLETYMNTNGITIN